MKYPFLLALLCSISLLSCDQSECSSQADCDDGLFCNGQESCLSGRCISAGSADCDDFRRCTTDRCDEDLDECVHTPTDLDGDGHFDPQCSGEDCDDSDPLIYPGAEELCDGYDNDCNEIVEEDRDGDTFFNPTVCSDGDDCDDSSAEVYPGAPEICDGIDNNCVLGTDDEEDTDGDGSIDPTCGGDDCDDEDPTRSPLNSEVCNGLDDDCDEAPDEDFLCIRGELYLCETECLSEGTVQCQTDCTFPELPRHCEPPDEICNGLDDDCNDLVDDNLDCSIGEIVECTTTCGTTGQGYCTKECSVPEPYACSPPAEVCNGLDDDCDGFIDEDFFCSVGQEATCVTTCGSVGTGTCTELCELASEEDCLPPDEICDDLIDNDCDEDYDCADEDCILDFACGY